MMYRLIFCLLIFTACQADAPIIEQEEAPSLPPPETDYVTEDFQWGFVDTRGNLVIEDAYDEVRRFDDNDRALVRQNGRWHFIDRSGKMRGRDWRAAWPYSEGLARIQNDQDSIGFIDLRALSIIPATFNDAGDFQEGHAWVRQGTNYGLIDRKGRSVIRPQYERLSDLNKGYLIFREERNYGLRTIEEVVVPAEYERLNYSGGKLLKARENGLYGYLMIANGDWLLPPAFQMASDFAEGRAAVMRDDRMELIDSTGTNYLVGDYQQCFYAGEGRWIVEDGGLYGAVDSSGRIAIPLVFQELQAFSDGFACYLIDELWGYIRPDGSQLSGPAYVLAWPFQGGYARVAKPQDGMVFIDTTLRVQFPARFIDIRDYSRGLAPVQVYRR